MRLAFDNSAQLANALKQASEAHHLYEQANGFTDADWAIWYANYLFTAGEKYWIGQHSEYGWPRAGEWAVLVRDGDKWKQLGEATSRTLAEAKQDKNKGSIIVRFHSDEWAGMLDGSLRRLAVAA